MPRWSPFEPYFWSLVEKTATSCWVWNGNIDSKGYGRIGIGDRRFRAHRVAYELLIGPIPQGLLACHTCDNKRCVRPDHIFLGTHADNMADCAAKGRNKFPIIRDEDHWMRKPESRAFRRRLSQIRSQEISSGRRVILRGDDGPILGTRMVR